MTATRMVVLSCDAPGCEAESTKGEWFTTVREAVEAASRRGWVRRRQGLPIDLCPVHAPEPISSRIAPMGDSAQLMPRELAAILSAEISDQPRVTVVPRGPKEQRVQPRDADHYEIAADYSNRPELLLANLEKALIDTPGVYLTTLVEHGRGPVNPAWPVWYRHPERLHSQVCALWRPVNPPPQAESPVPRTTRRD